MTYQKEDLLKQSRSGKKLTDKYYIGFFDGGSLAAVTDLIDGYPEDDIAYLGLFMMDHGRQGNGIGTAMIGKTAAYLRSIGKRAVRLAIDKGNL